VPRWRCHTCGETVTTVAGIDRHNTETGHRRYDQDLGL
jgi:hypothetical protein